MSGAVGGATEKIWVLSPSRGGAHGRNSKGHGPGVCRLRGRLVLGEPGAWLTVMGCVTSLEPMIAGTVAATNAAPAPAAFRRGDERLIRLTSSAADKVRGLLHKQGRPTGVLRVAVVGGGCSGLQYKMDLQDRPQNRDILVESAGVQVVVDPKSALYVTGSELDYLDALQGGGFKVTNPNAATSCSCGESFSA